MSANVEEVVDLDAEMAKREREEDERRRHQDMVIKMDRLLNIATGQGGPNDKALATFWTFEDYPNPYILDAIHQTDTVAGRIAETPPRDALASGFEIKSPEPIPWREDVKGDALERWLRKNRVLWHLRYALMISRIYGGSGIVIHVDDGRSPDQPVDRDNIKRVTLSRARDRWELIPIQWFTDFADPRYEEPSLYNVVPRSYGGATRGAPITVHADRVLRFDGYDLTPDAYARNLWWGGSVLWRCKDRIERFVGAEQAMSILLTEAKEDILFVKGLRDIEADRHGKGMLIDRATDISTTRGLLGTTILDAEERYETRMRPLNGVGDIYDRALLSVSQAAEMPVTMLFGDAAKGLSADDKAGRTYYAATIDAIRTERITPALEHLLMLAFLSDDGPTAGRNAEGWYVEFEPYEKESDAERADREKKQAEADAINIGAGVYSPEDVRDGRYVVGAPGEVIVDVKEEDRVEEEVNATTGEAKTPAAPAGDDVAKTALNGAQVASMVTVAQAVKDGALTPEQAEAIITASFPVDAATARIIAGISTGDPAPPPAIAEQVEEDAAQADAYQSPPRDEGLEPEVESGQLDQYRAPVNTEDASFDEDDEVTDFPEQGGTKKVSLRNSQHGLFDPAYAADLKENWPEIWSRGGNIEGNNQYRRLTPIAARGGSVETDTEDMAVRKREAWGSRHKGNKRINGVVALIKWLVVGDIGEARMKRVIEDQKDRIRKKRSKEKADEIDWSTWMPERSKEDYAEDSMMIALYPPEEWAREVAGLDFVSEPAEKLHMTLVYLPHVDPDNVERIEDSIREASFGFPAFDLKVSGPGVFVNGKHAHVLLTSGLGLNQLRAAIANWLGAGGLIGDQNHDFIPHMTIGYHDEQPAAQLAASMGVDYKPWKAAEIRLVQGDKTIFSHPLEVIDDEKQDADEAKTPAPPEDRIEGSAKNKEGSASGQRGGIAIDDATEKALREKVEEHNEKHEAKSKRVNLGMLKAVWRRGAGAFSTSHRPGMTRPQWSMGRVNAFLHLVSKGKPKAKTYTTDNDLLPEGHPRKSEEKEDGGPDDPVTVIVHSDGRNNSALLDLIWHARLLGDIGASRTFEFKGKTYGVDGDGSAQIEEIKVATLDSEVAPYPYTTSAIILHTNRYVANEGGVIDFMRDMVGYGERNEDDPYYDLFRSISCEPVHGLGEKVIQVNVSEGRYGDIRVASGVDVYDGHITYEEATGMTPWKMDSIKMDPYSGPDDPGLPEKVHKMSAEARNRFVEAFNAAHREDPGDEGRAFAIAYAAAEKG